jgi:long-subunit acyl-CoA synthetase (AMP-forming)
VYTRLAEDLTIAVVTGRSEWAVIAMLAVWQPNCVYVPLAEGAPEQRLRHMLEHVRPAAILTDKHNAARLKNARSECPPEKIVVTAEFDSPAPTH